MPLAEALGVTLDIARILETLDVPHLVGGSVASSLQGIARATLDIDLVVGEPRAWEPGPTISNNFGFGGHNGAVVIGPGA